MAVYFGSHRAGIKIKNESYHFNLFVKNTPLVNHALLKSSDNFILQDKRGLYLTTKDGEKL